MSTAEPRTPLAERLAERIAGAPARGIRADGSACACLSFRDYMAMCLYDSDYGYYRAGPTRVGREGDFYTSAYIGDIMGETLAAFIAGGADGWFGAGRPVDVIDWGGGTGRLAAQLLRGWRAIGGEPLLSRFRLTLVDGNPAHLRQAAEALRAESEQARVLDERAAYGEDWTARPVVIVANELLDAFPVRRVARVGGRLLECAVAWDERTASPVGCWLEEPDPEALRWLEREGVRVREGQTVEIGLDAEAWLARISGLLGDALLVLIDYGDETEELTAAHRMHGTLLAYRRHEASDDPYAYPGEQDLTAHVNFSAIRRAAAACGWVEEWYGTQKRWLVDNGVLARLTEHTLTDPFHPVVRRNRAVRQLLLSDGMSELFKVQVLRKRATAGRSL